ncbi:hypothetical protein C8R43DRAFT_945476 [Mycena crocata]|nr:hypothetical protein C8R43DRAFT_945476 [Mycena crocata]
MPPRRTATIKKNETAEQWRLKLLNSTKDEVMKDFGYEDLKEWHEVQLAEDARIEEEATKERLRLEQLKKDEDARLRKEKEDQKRKAAEAADKGGEGEFLPCWAFRLFSTSRFFLAMLSSTSPWLTDVTHTIFICIAVWEYAIENFGNFDIVHKILGTVRVEFSGRL